MVEVFVFHAVTTWRNKALLFSLYFEFFVS